MFAWVVATALALAAGREPLTIHTAAWRERGSTMTFTTTRDASRPTSASYEQKKIEFTSDNRVRRVTWVSQAGEPLTIPELADHFDDPATAERYLRLRKTSRALEGSALVVAALQLGVGAGLIAANTGPAAPEDYLETAEWRDADAARRTARIVGITLVGTGSLTAVLGLARVTNPARPRNNADHWYPMEDLQHRVDAYNEDLRSDTP